MALTAGARLGRYEILDPLDAGGMGEVYRARDTRLDRLVAIKILASELAADAQLQERFEREARAIAALNHPHICTLHDVGHDGDVAYLVMELLEGDTLAARLGRGALSLERALEYAIQIASALDRAHRSGIVHRDLKPGNIMLTKSGAKLLDFGLAKRATPAVTTAGLSLLPTTPPNLTAQGAILGTFQYMAPEQLEGLEADARTDIFAFGTVLYEMITGRKAFEGKSQVGLIGAILEREPISVATIVPTSPPALDRVLRRCLAKSPDDRWQSAADLGAQLKWITESTQSATTTTDSSSSAAPSATHTRRATRVWMTIAAVAITIAAAAGITAYRFWQAIGTERVVRFTVPPPDKALFDSGQIGFLPALSPDGKQLAFTARDASGLVQVWVRPLDGLTARPLPGTDGGAYPFWSPDSRSIGFFSQSRLQKIDIAGGPPVVLREVAGGRGATWNRDGVILYAVSGAFGLFRVGMSGGEPAPVTTLAPDQRGHRAPWFLPDGRHFLYVASLANGSAELYAGSLDSHDSKRLGQTDSNATYALPGDLLFVRQTTLFRQPFDAKALEVVGDAVPVADQIAVSGLIASVSVAENGVLTYRSGPSTAGNVQLGWFDRTGKRLETLGGPASFRGIDVSPDGKRIAVHRHDTSGGDIWLLDAARHGLSRFTFDPAQDNASPIWSPDGTRIAFGSLRNGKWGIYVKAADGSNTEELIVESEASKMPMSWSPDGQSLVYWVLDAKTQSDQWLVPLSGDKKPVPLLQTPFNENHPQVSPNGKWIAYHSNETGRAEIYVRSFPRGNGKWQVSTAGGVFARWRPDGKELFYLTSNSLGKLMSVKVNPAAATFEYDNPTELFDSGYINFTHGLNYHTYGIAPDGNRFLIPRPEGSDTDTQGAPLTVVLNWRNATR